MTTQAEQLKALADKPVKVSKYSGEIPSVTVDAWLTQQLLKYSDAGITDDEVMARHLVKNGLIGKAREWVTPYLLETSTNWDIQTHPCKKVENLRILLKQRTGQDKKRDIIALKKLQNLKQRGRPIQAYIQEYYSLKAEVPADLKKNKMAMARYYWNGLDERIITQLAANDNIETWEDSEWISRTKQMEEFRNRNKITYEPWNNKNNTHYTPRYIDPYAMEVDKMKQRKTRYNNNNHKKKGNCHKCGKPGHWAKECYQNNNNKVVEVNKIRNKSRFNKKRKGKFTKRNNRRPFGRKGAYIESEETDDELDFL